MWDSCVDVFSLVCPDDCPEWEKLENQQGDGAVEFTGAENEAECKTACLDDAGCVGFDLDTNTDPDSCWLHGDVDNFTPPKDKQGVNLYKLVARCPEGM